MATRADQAPLWDKDEPSHSDATAEFGGDPLASSSGDNMGSEQVARYRRGDQPLQDQRLADAAQLTVALDREQEPERAVDDIGEDDRAATDAAKERAERDFAANTQARQREREAQKPPGLDNDTITALLKDDPTDKAA